MNSCISPKTWTIQHPSSPLSVASSWSRSSVMAVNSGSTMPQRRKASKKRTQLFHLKSSKMVEMEVSRFVELLVSTVFLLAGNIWEKCLKEVSNCENPLLMILNGRFPIFLRLMTAGQTVFFKVLRCPRGELD